MKYERKAGEGVVYCAKGVPSYCNSVSDAGGQGNLRMN